MVAAALPRAAGAPRTVTLAQPMAIYEVHVGSWRRAGADGERWPSCDEPAGFLRFVERCHAAELGIILDWVPGHFPADADGLVRFDGTHLYEHADPREGSHPDWGTLIYNYGRFEVRDFLIGNARCWIERFGIDGLRESTPWRR